MPQGERSRGSCALAMDGWPGGGAAAPGVAALAGLGSGLGANALGAAALGAAAFVAGVSGAGEAAVGAATLGTAAGAAG